MLENAAYSMTKQKKSSTNPTVNAVSYQPTLRWANHAIMCDGMIASDELPETELWQDFTITEE